MIPWNRSHDGHVTSQDGRWQIDPLCCGTPRPVFYELTALLTGQKHGTTHQSQKAAKNEAQELVMQETTANNSQPPQTTANAAPQHGGPRQPGPGKKLGRPAKKPKEKATCLTITLSSAKTLKALKSRAKRAKLKPGAYIERELGL